MALLSEDDAAAAEAIAELCYTNPFTPRRIELERQALGPGFAHAQALWSRTSLRFQNPNVPRLRERTRELLHAARGQLERGDKPSKRERRLYLGLTRYYLFDALDDEGALLPLVDGVIAARLSGEPGPDQGRIAIYDTFRSEGERCLGVGGLFPAQLSRLPHLFAISVQARLSFSMIFQSILGTSRAAARLRADTWASIFTYDMRRYEQRAYRRMHDVPTMVLGPSGTGKELVARAIGLCGYVPFDGEKQQFDAPLAGDFRALNLSAMEATLIASELFGHKKGAFTGAIDNRQGFLSLCSKYGAVFLDEIGELDPSIQVKLLRVLQSRQFEPVGDKKSQLFHGRVIAATNRELGAAIEAGDFRSDFFYRLCADTITTPSLAEQLRDAPDDLHAFVEHILDRMLGPEAADDDGDDDDDWDRPEGALADEVVAFIRGLGPDYPWPGNVRELEQSVRSFVVKRDYKPMNAPSVRPPQDGRAALRTTLRELDITASALVSQYCDALHDRLGSINEVAETTGLSRKTVAKRLSSLR